MKSKPLSRRLCFALQYRLDSKLSAARCEPSPCHRAIHIIAAPFVDRRSEICRYDQRFADPTPFDRALQFGTRYLTNNAPGQLDVTQFSEVTVVTGCDAAYGRFHADLALYTVTHRINPVSSTIKILSQMIWLPGTAL